MQILFILGNGFDISLGMKTEYKNFCSSYQETESDSEVIKKLKSHIQCDIDTWSDLELALGNYTDQVETLEDFITIHDDLLNNLGEYLESIESTIDFDKIDRDKFFEYLCFPEKYLPPKDYSEITNFRAKWSKHNWNTNIVTLNYTRTVEKIIGEDKIDFPIGSHHSLTDTISFNGITHIHGYTDYRMVLGINDISQLKNQAFHGNRKILNTFIKSKNNQSQRHMLDSAFSAEISSANLICIFGSSLGDTDNIWWEQIGTQLLNSPNCELIIFSWGEKIHPRFSQKIAESALEIKEVFLQKTKLSSEFTNQIFDKIHVGVRTDMFKDINLSPAPPQYSIY